MVVSGGAAAATSQYLGVIVFAVTFAACLNALGEPAEPLIKIIEIANDVIMKCAHSHTCCASGRASAESNMHSHASSTCKDLFARYTSVHLNTVSPGLLEWLDSQACITPHLTNACRAFRDKATPTEL